jgi:hypothetical protein
MILTIFDIHTKLRSIMVAQVHEIATNVAVDWVLPLMQLRIKLAFHN